MIRRHAVLCAATLALASAPVSAQNYPSKPIRLVLPFAGGTDVVGRLIALKLSPALGQQVVPDPRLGAGGNIRGESRPRRLHAADGRAARRHQPQSQSEIGL
jgi:tripartite-type tricarboxylate transporter receptor subunit TctC